MQHFIRFCLEFIGWESSRPVTAFNPYSPALGTSLGGHSDFKQVRTPIHYPHTKEGKSEEEILKRVGGVLPDWNEVSPHPPNPIFGKSSPPEPAFFLNGSPSYSIDHPHDENTSVWLWNVLSRA